MGIVWNPIGAAGALAAVLVWTMAAAVYLARPDRDLNRRLSLFMAVEGFFVCGLAFSYLRDDMPGAYAWRAVHYVALLALPWVYLRFLATLQTPLVRPFQGRRVDLALILIALLFPALWFMRPEWFVVGMIDTLELIPWLGVHGPVYRFALEALGVLFLYGLAASVSAYRRAPSDSVTRRRAKAFAVAFGARDLLYVLHFFVLVPMFWRWPEVVWIQGATALAVPTITTLYVLLVAYGILRSQLFDIDLKIKWGVRRGTVAGLFLAIVFAAVETAQNLVSESFGLAIGAAATVLLVLAIRPLERLATRVSDVAMPHVDDSEAYLAFRKLEVYKEALESSLIDGDLDGREGEILVALRRRLGISEGVAAALERDMRATLGIGRPAV